MIARWRLHHASDVAKPSAAARISLCLGGMLAGHEESGGSVVEENGEKFMLFYGMSSNLR